MLKSKKPGDNLAFSLPLNLKLAAHFYLFLILRLEDFKAKYIASNLLARKPVVRAGEVGAAEKSE